MSTTDIATNQTEQPTSRVETLSLLGNDRRLRVVHDLVENEAQTTTTKALATRIAEAEADERDETADDLYKSVYVSLQQTHLPKLADHGIVTYDPEANTVGPGPRLDEAEVYVKPENATESTLPPAVALVAGAGLLTVVAARFGAPVVSAVEPAAWAALALFTVLAVVVARRAGWTPSD
ncbi:MAG: ArsR family transcriptional regulator [Haloferacaceae archaeon]